MTIKSRVTTKTRETKINGYSVTLPVHSILHSILLDGLVWNDVFLNAYSPKVCFLFCLVVFCCCFLNYSLRKKIDFLCSIH